MQHTAASTIAAHKVIHRRRSTMQASPQDLYHALLATGQVPCLPRFPVQNGPPHRHAAPASSLLISRQSTRNSLACAWERCESGILPRRGMDGRMTAANSFVRSDLSGKADASLTRSERSANGSSSHVLVPGTPNVTLRHGEKLP